MHDERDETAVLGGVDRRHALAVLALLALVALSGCSGIPQHHRVCGVCSGAGDVVRGDLTVEESTLEIRTFENGSSRWTVRMDVAGPATANLSSGTDAIERAIETGFADVEVDSGDLTTGHYGDARNVSVRATGDELVATYRVPNVAVARSDGYVVFRQFHSAYRQDDDHLGTFDPGTDRIRVHAPPGMAVVNDPQRATVSEDGRSVVWEHPEERWKDEIAIPSDAYVVFGPERSDAEQFRGTAVVAQETLAWSGPWLLVLTGAAAGLIALFVGVAADVVTGGTLRAWIRRPSVDAMQAIGSLCAVSVVVLATMAHVVLGEVGRPFELVFGGTVGIGVLAAGSLGVAVAREHRSTIPLGAVTIALPAYAVPILTFDGIGSSRYPDWLLVFVPWTATTVVLATVGFLLGFKLGGGNVREE